MTALDRRRFLATAAACAAVPAWAGLCCDPLRTPALERRDLYPEGVASGDPDAHSVILWTRRPWADADGRAEERAEERAEKQSHELLVEVARDAQFRDVVVRTAVPVDAASDWTARVLVGGLAPARDYWYRFVDAEGHASRTGRTRTAPTDDDPRPVHFAFVSCQNVNQGAQNAFRRMIWEDERAVAEQRLDFVLHLGDFIYEIVWYPEDRPQGMYDRRLRDIVRYAHGEKIRDFHVPTTTEDYRAVYRAYLHDPDIQDARARFPFVTMWDNHEFSWLGWQSIQEFDGEQRPAQSRKVAANQAWFEYQPARVGRPGVARLDRFDPPPVADRPVLHFDDDGLGTEPDNLAAIDSLVGYRALRFGAHVDLLVTDQHSYRSQEPTSRKEAADFSSRDFLDFFPEEAMAILDGGRLHDHGRPPATIRFGERQIPNFQRESPPQTLLGRRQKAWFLDRLGASTATWKIWGNTAGTLDWRADPQHLPAGLTKPWPGAGYAGFGGGDHSSAYVERGEIYDFVARRGITGFATVAGDRHSFWAGLAAKSLPPGPFDPVGVAFVTGSISAPGLVEAEEHALAKDHPLRALYLVDPPHGGAPEASVNLLLRHGVRSCLDYAQQHDYERAVRLGDPAMAPHLSFVDMGGHGYSVVTASRERLDVTFVCLPRPLERSATPDGGPVNYRIIHTAPLWSAGERPRLVQRIVEGDPGLGR